MSTPTSDFRLLSIKDIVKLERRRFRDELGVFLIEGKKILEEAVKAQAPVLQVLATQKFVNENRDFFADLNIATRDVVTIADHNAMKLTEAKTPQGVFAVVKKKDLSLQDMLKHNFIAVFENVRDPGNVGTMIRTADWFGVQAIIVSKEGADIYNDKVLRSTMGSLFHLDIYVAEDLLSDLEEMKNSGFRMIVSRPEEKNTVTPADLKKFCLILGNESTGTSREVDALADASFSIPKYGEAESLNVAVSFGIMVNQLIVLLPQSELPSML